MVALSKCQQTLEIDNDSVRFVHQLLQEYFAAWMLQQRWLAGLI
ncbi:MAG: hypothetical protein R2932_20965 [Caldilineaceae bacterium]